MLLYYPPASTVARNILRNTFIIRNTLAVYMVPYCAVIKQYMYYLLILVTIITKVLYEYITGVCSYTKLLYYGKNTFVYFFLLKNHTIILHQALLSSR